MRLIDADVLMKIFEDKMFNSELMCPVIKILDVMSILEEQPTAYNVDAVVEELKEYKANNHPKCEDCAGCTAWKCDCSNVRNMAIDDFAERLHDLCGFEIDDIRYPYLLDESRIDEVAEQLKEGSADNE